VRGGIKERGGDARLHVTQLGGKFNIFYTEIRRVAEYFILLAME